MKNPMQEDLEAIALIDRAKKEQEQSGDALKVLQPDGSLQTKDNSQKVEK